jgi:Xaa-Pro aminopeptidase
MISTFLAAAALAGGFQHPTPSPPPELPASVYRERRDRVMKALDGCIALIGAQGEMSGITEDYRQDADFYWLTGINEPGAFLVFAPKSPFSKVTLFLKPRDPEAERWTGPREPISPELKERYGVDRVRRGSPDSTLAGMGENHDCVSIIAPPSMAKEDRNDADLAVRVAQRFTSARCWRGCVKCTVRPKSSAWSARFPLRAPATRR